MQQRAVQRRVAIGELYRVRSGIATPMPEARLANAFRREKGRILAARARLVAISLPIPPWRMWLSGTRRPLITFIVFYQSHLALTIMNLRVSRHKLRFGG